MTIGMQSRVAHMKSKLEHDLEYLIEELRDDELDDEERYYLYRDIDEVERQLKYYR